MKKIIISIIAIALSVGLFAQTQDSLLRRQMELDRDFNPTLLDADKINSLPALPQPAIQKANTNYSTWAGRVTPPIEIAVADPSDIMTTIPFSTQRGYLFFNAGNYANIDGAFGYRLVENEKHNLAFTFLHNSTNGDIEFTQDNSDPAVNTATYMDNLGQLNYLHNAETMTLKMNLSYLHSIYNYYGNTFGEDPFFNNENQNLGILNANFGIQSVESDVMNYRGFIDFKNFTTKQSEIPQYDWMKGNQLHAMVGFDKPFQGGGSRIGIDGSLLTTFYGGDADNYFLVNAAPYIKFEGLNSHAKIGVDILFQNSENSKIRVVPNVNLRWGITEFSSLYAKVHGGFDNNTFIDMMNESRYVLTDNPIRASFSHIDLEGGAKIGELSGFRFDIFGGFRKTDDEHFLVLNNIESLRPLYGSLSHSYIGGMIQSNIWTPLDISLRIKKNFYDVTDMITDMTVDETEVSIPMAYNKPGVEIDLRSTLEIIDNLKLNLNYYYAGDRWTHFNNTNIQMNDINDLSVGGIYDINNSFSLNLRANNIFSQKYDIWYGYPAQGINIMGGFTFKF